MQGVACRGETAVAFPLVESIVLVLLELLSRVDSFVTLQPAKLVCPGDFPGENSGAGCHFLLQGIFPTQALIPPLLLGR